MTWKKVKGASGYCIVEEYTKFVGYNIFGQKLHDVYTKTYFNKGNSYKIKNANIEDIIVYSYAKHRGKYYSTEGYILKKKKNMGENSVSRRVG